MVGIYILEYAGFLPNVALPITPPIAFGIVFANVVFLSGLLYLLLRDQRASLDRLKENEINLSKTNQNLREVQETLELEVAERTSSAEQARQETERVNATLEKI